jgi:hypothetical protein
MNAIFCLQSYAEILNFIVETPKKKQNYAISESFFVILHNKA